MSSEYTTHGVSRAGDDYQDLLGVELVVEHLEHPDRYEWIVFEADEFGFLDDVVALRSDGTYVARQIKFTVRPDDPDYQLGWEFLLQRRKGLRGPRASLIEKWADSVKTVQSLGPIHELSLCTNRRPSESFANSLVGPERDRVSLAAVPDAIRRDLIERLGNESNALDFFHAFRFKVDLPHPQTLEPGIRRRFFRLGGDERGWLNLLYEVRQWAKYRERPFPDGRIRYRHILDAAGWHRLRGLTQDFRLPADYVLSSRRFHRNLISIVATASGSKVIVLTGPPGSGKSTYLSYLTGVLRRRGVPVIRHHYYLSLSDHSGDRFDHRRVIESLMQQIESRYHDALEVEQIRNPVPDAQALSRWLEICARHFQRQALPFVVIVDGLDHVFRERRSADELNALFDALLPPLPGVVIVVGTQSVATDQLPSRLSIHAPRETWITIPRLTVDALASILRKHLPIFELPLRRRERTNVLHDFATALHGISQGHPLHIHYSLLTLVSRAPHVTLDMVRALPACPDGDIETYYRLLWEGLSPLAQQMLHLLADVGFSWPPGGLAECLSGATSADGPLATAEREITHLLRRDELGTSAFHASLIAYVKRRPDHREVEGRLRQQLLTWLRTLAPQYWKWAFQWIVESDLGDDASLCNEPHNTWVARSIAQGYPLHQIIEILNRSAWASLDRNELTRCVHAGLLSTYAENARYQNEEAFARLLAALLVPRPEQSLRNRLLAHLETLSDSELVVFATLDRATGPSDLPERCLAIFSERVKQSNQGTSRVARDRKTDLLTNVRLLGLLPDVQPARVVQFLQQRRDDSRDQSLRAYCHQLARRGAIGDLRVVASLQLSPEDSYDVASEAVSLACLEAFSLAHWPESLRTNPLVACYGALRESRFIPGAVSVQFNAARYDRHQLYERHAEFVRELHRQFFSSVATALSANAIDPTRPSDTQNGEAWIDRFVTTLRAAGVTVGRALRDDRAGNALKTLFAMVGLVAEPYWPEDQLDFQHFTQARHALVDVSLDLQMLAISLPGERTVSRVSLESATMSPYWTGIAWLERYLERGVRLLSDEAAQFLIDKELDNLDRSVILMSERAGRCMTLAHLSGFHQLAPMTRDKLLELGSLSLIGYRDHKDYFLFEVLDAVNSCAGNARPELDRWLPIIAKSVHNITDITDGDETGHLKIDLAETLLTVAPKYFAAYYEYLIGDENWDAAEHAISIFLKKADLTDSVQRAIATTAIDSRSLSALSQRATAGDVSAENVLQDISNFLGGITPAKDPSNSSPINQNDREPPRPDMYPPEQLASYVKACYAAGYYSIDTLLREWFGFWASRSPIDSFVATLLPQILENPSRYRGASDMLFDLSLTHYGRSAAYPLIVAAHKEEHGWSRHFVNPTKARERFRKFARVYPDRWIDFIRDTARSRISDERRLAPVTGLSMLVEFLLEVNQPAHAVNVTATLIAVLEERMAGQPLSAPRWYSVHRE